MSTSKHLTLMGVELYEISSDYLYELRQKQPDGRMIFDHLPEYTFNRNAEGKGMIVCAREHLQFVGLDKPSKPEKFLFFNLTPIDSLLDYEVNEGGIEEIFENVNFENYLSVFAPHTEEDHSKFRMPDTNYLIIAIMYCTSTDYYSGGSETDVDYEIEGYLDHNLQRQSFDPPQRSGNQFETDDVVKLPLGEEGVIKEYVDLPWASRYNVKITKSNGFNQVGEVVDYFEKDLELVVK